MTGWRSSLSLAPASSWPPTDDQGGVANAQKRNLSSYLQRRKGDHPASLLRGNPSSGHEGAREKGAPWNSRNKSCPRRVATRGPSAEKCCCAFLIHCSSAAPCCTSTWFLLHSQSACGCRRCVCSSIRRTSAKFSFFRGECSQIKHCACGRVYPKWSQLERIIRPLLLFALPLAFFFSHVHKSRGLCVRRLRSSGGSSSLTKKVKSETMGEFAFSHSRSAWRR